MLGRLTITPQGSGGCPEWRGTRSALLALRNSNGLSAGCLYVITDYSRGTVGSAEIALLATDSNTLPMEGHAKTTFDNISWACLYDIDSNRLTQLKDNRGNIVSAPDSVDSFPWGVASVTNNEVFDARLNYVSGSANENRIYSSAVVTINSGSMQRNTISMAANVTLTSADFRENVVEGDATVTITTSGDVDNCRFEANSNTIVSDSANMDNCTVANDGNVTLTNNAIINHVRVLQSANLVVSGGNLTESTLEQDAQVTIVSGSNTENTFGLSTIYNQVGTGRINYSDVGGTTTWTNGNTNLSNISAFVSTVNTTGSAGTIANSAFDRFYAVNMQNIPSLTITESSIADYSQISANGASRLYATLLNLRNGARILVSSGARLDTSYSGVSSYGYIQVLQGFLRVNYSEVSSLGYIQHNTPNTNYVDRSRVTSQSRIRFLNTVANCRVYYSTASDGGLIEHRGTSSGCYIYYCSSNSAGQIYCTNSTNARIYYCRGEGRGFITSQGNTTTHYMYYCTASASGYVQSLNNSGSIRMYAIHASSQAIARLQNCTGNARWYYSSFTAYYYMLITLTGTTTRSAHHGSGRRSYTITNPPNGAYTQNF